MGKIQKFAVLRMLKTCPASILLGFVLTVGETRAEANRYVQNAIHGIEFIYDPMPYAQCPLHFLNRYNNQRL